MMKSIIVLAFCLVSRVVQASEVEEEVRHFVECARLVGSSLRDLEALVGKASATESNGMGASFAHFRKSRILVSFKEKDQVVFGVSFPIGNAAGYPDKHPFEMLGVRSGMSKADVEKVLGVPDLKAVRVWGYHKLSIDTNRGGGAFLCIYFSEGSNVEGLEYRPNHERNED